MRGAVNRTPIQGDLFAPTVAEALDIRGWYNGWNWNQRRAVTPIQNEAMRRGELIRPTVCSICGFSDPSDPKGRGYTFAHLENYSDPIGGVLPACKRCHHVLHARFTKPDTWLAIVAEHYRAGAWFTLLTMRPEDMLRPFGELYPGGLLSAASLPIGATDRGIH